MNDDLNIFKIIKKKSWIKKQHLHIKDWQWDNLQMFRKNSIIPCQHF